MDIEFRLLGEIEVHVDGATVDIGHARQRCVLAALLVDVNRAVPADQLIDRVWADQWPQHARAALSSYLSRLRHVLAMAPGFDIKRQPGGYVLSADPLAVDLHRFRDRVAQAGATDDPKRAAELLGQALELWRGPALNALDTPWINSVRESLDAERLAAELDRNDLALAEGRHAAVLGALVGSAVAYPLDERLAGQLMLALYRCGRQADALQHYNRLRLQLAEELGTDPSPSLQLLHKQILTADTELIWSHEPARARPVPRQLPAPPRAFSGRAGYLAQLDALLPSIADEAPGATVISAISGTPGVGKTALALYWAQRMMARFPDGQLYVNLRGFEPERHAVSPAEAVRGFLDALDVPPQRVPSNLDAQEALYRSLVADRQMLIVLDNARDAEQVRPLLPGTPGSVVLVTSRNQLTALIAGEGAYPLVLDLLTDAEARELLARHLGRHRAEAEPDAVDEIIARCTGLPLALSIVAARAATRPGFPLTTLAHELRDTHGTLDALADGDPATDVRAAFSLSYHALGEPAAHLFRLLGLHPGADVSLHAAASLTAEPVARARRALTELTRAHLLEEHLPGRYTLHDLLRAYASELTHGHDSEPDRRAAMRRILDHYLHTAYAAAMLIESDRDPIGVPPVAEGVTLTHPDDIDKAFAWFTTEHPGMLALIRWAAETGFDTHAWQLAWTLTTYLNRRGRWHDWADTHETALAAAQRLVDWPAQAFAHRSLGRAYARIGRDGEALHHFQRALDLFDTLGDPVGQARTHIALSWLYERQGRPGQALTHDRHALALYREAGHKVGITASLNNIGWHQAHLGQYAEALLSCQQALVLHQEIDSRHSEADTLASIGYIYHRQGDYQAAVEHYERALAMQRELGSRVTEAETLTQLGDVHQAAGDQEAATGSWRGALAILEELGHPDAERVRARMAAI